ncbi:MAG TPA: 3-oxoadipate enol-lactonase [Vicinamibacterales bacterium]|nr:3-oxoadipate enol-lactonase [Vicinamibacterales bacterium]
MDHLIEHDGCRIAYVKDGPVDGPALLMSNSIGTTRELWARQIEALSSVYHVIRYDTRGHGQSSVPAGEYSLEQLGGDVLAILDAEGIASAHICGLSLGGITAMWLGINAPQRVDSLVLANTAARIGSAESWTERLALVRSGGMAAVAERAMGIWFSDEFRRRSPDVVHDYRAMIESCSPDGYAGCCAVLRDSDLRPAIKDIRCPALVIAGRRDMGTTIEAAEFITSQISGSTMVALDSAHLSNVECAAEFSAAVMDFLGSSRRTDP